MWSYNSNISRFVTFTLFAQFLYFSDNSPAYGRYFRGNVAAMQQIQNNTDPVVRIERPRPILSHLHSLVAAGANTPGNNSSASQTLSDLAAAASDQLMAENAAAAAAVAADASVAADAAEAAAEAASGSDFAF